MGENYATLDALVKKAHVGEITLTGSVSVSRGNAMAQLLCTVLCMPPSAASVPLTVRGSHCSDKMLWARDFGGVKMTSCFVKDGDFLVEQMGPIKLWLKLTSENGTLRYKLMKASCLGFTLLKRFSPTLEAFESEDSGFYVFGVRISLPLIGKLIEYQGKLVLG